MREMKEFLKVCHRCDHCFLVTDKNENITREFLVEIDNYFPPLSINLVVKMLRDLCISHKKPSSVSGVNTFSYMLVLKVYLRHCPFNLYRFNV